MRGKKTGPVICPKCGEEAKTTDTQYGRRDKCCGLHSWGGKALACQETHDARKAAHEAFDAVWKSGRENRNKAYQLLADYLNIPEPECHMSIMPKERAVLVPPAIAELWPDE